jgi:hypothetical protein
MTMAARLQIFDPPMCCPTGVCGPSVDPELIRFARDLRWLEAQGVGVDRFNLAQEPAPFAGNPAVVAALNSEGVDALPMLFVDGELLPGTGYPTRDVLAASLSLPVPG